MAVHTAAANDVFGDDLFCVVISLGVSLVESGVTLCKFLRILFFSFSYEVAENYRENSENWEIYIM